MNWTQSFYFLPCNIKNQELVLSPLLCHEPGIDTFSPVFMNQVSVLSPLQCHEPSIDTFFNVMSWTKRIDTFSPAVMNQENRYFLPCCLEPRESILSPLLSWTKFRFFPPCNVISREPVLSPLYNAMNPKSVLSPLQCHEPRISTFRPHALPAFSEEMLKR